MASDGTRIIGVLVPPEKVFDLEEAFTGYSLRPEEPANFAGLPMTGLPLGPGGLPIGMPLPMSTGGLPLTGALPMVQQALSPHGMNIQTEQTLALSVTILSISWAQCWLVPLIRTNVICSEVMACSISHFPSVAGCNARLDTTDGTTGSGGIAGCGTPRCGGASRSRRGSTR